MPRQKTNKSAAKRFKKIGGSTGVKRKQTNRRHLLTVKNRKRKRNLRGTTNVDKTNMDSVKLLLPGL